MKDNHRLRLYYDGYCPFCRASARLIGRLDWLGRIDLVSFRHDNSYLQLGISADALEEAMHVIDLRAAPVIYAGYPAVVAVVRNLPLLWPLWPIAWAAGRLGLGARIYRWLARNRIIVPDASHCAGGVCQLPAERDHAK